MDSIMYSNTPMFDRSGNYLGYRYTPSRPAIDAKIALLEHQAGQAKYGLNFALHVATCAKIELRHCEDLGWYATETGDPFTIQDVTVPACGSSRSWMRRWRRCTLLLATTRELRPC